MSNKPTKEGFDLPPTAEDYRQARLAQESEEPGLEGQDMRLAFDGRTLQLMVLINTDEDPKTVEKRIQRAASEASNGEWRMALVSALVIEGMRAKNFWRSIRRAVRKGKRQAKEGGDNG